VWEVISMKCWDQRMPMDLHDCALTVA